MEIDAVGADLGQQVGRLDRREPASDRLAKWVAPEVANSPQAQGELVLLFGLVAVGHGNLLLILRIQDWIHAVWRVVHDAWCVLGGTIVKHERPFVNRGLR